MLKNLVTLALTVFIGFGGIAAWAETNKRLMEKVSGTQGFGSGRRFGSNYHRDSMPPDHLRHAKAKWAKERAAEAKSHPVQETADDKQKAAPTKPTSDAPKPSLIQETKPNSFPVLNEALPPRVRNMRPFNGESPEQSEKSIMQTLETEMKRNYEKLKNSGTAPLYFLAYRLYDTQFTKIAATNGALVEKPNDRVNRVLSIDLRVGSPKLDNTHFLRSDHSRPPANWDQSKTKNSILPALGADIPLQEAIWLRTDEAFKRAQSRFQSILASKDVLAAEEDQSGDFTLQPAQIYDSGIKKVDFDRKAWEEKVKEWSKLFNLPWIENSEVSLGSYPSVRYIVDTDGSRIVEQSEYYVMFGHASTLTDDGMKLTLTDYEVHEDPSKLCSDEERVKRFKKLIDDLKELRSAPPAESFVGPAILSGRAAAVFFHETFGHRIEAVHAKSEVEGKTFVKKVGTQVMPTFINVIDDPTISDINGEFINGHYEYDDEGVKGQRAVLAKNGILTGFLMSRTPLQGFEKSNGHGRGAPGWNPMGRQANLIVSVDKKKQFSDQALRAMLIKEAKRQKKPYGLYFESISGGFTGTSSRSEQTYTITPLIVYKVFVDGRPDEMIRGAQLVGTPLAALEKIIAGGDTIGIFNGACGRESGHIRNCDASPAMLLQSIEIKRSAKTFEKKPILPDPTPGEEQAKEPGAAPSEASGRVNVSTPDKVTRQERKAAAPDAVSQKSEGSK